MNDSYTSRLKDAFFLNKYALFFPDILQYASCWNRTEVTVETTQCHVEQSDMITSLQQQSGQMNSTQMREGWCE